MEQQEAFNELFYHNGPLWNSSPLLKLAMRKWHGRRAYDDVLERTAKLGDLELVECALDAGAHVHYKEDMALYQALSDQNIAMARLLLSRGAHATARNGLFLTLIAKTEKLEFLQLIMDYPKVDVNAQSGGALMAAVRNNWIPGAKFLLEHQANPNSRRWANILYAGWSGLAEMAKLLMEHGAKPPSDATVLDADRHSALDIWSYRFHGNNVLRIALRLAADKLNALAILQIMRRWHTLRWDAIRWRDHVHLGPAFGRGKNYDAMLEQLLHEMNPFQKRLLLAATVRFDSRAAIIVLQAVRYDASWDGGKTLYLAAMIGETTLCGDLVWRHSDNLTIGHLVTAAGIAAKHLNPMTMIDLRQIIKEWDDLKTRLLAELAENECAAKRQTFVGNGCRIHFRGNKTSNFLASD